MENSPDKIAELTGGIPVTTKPSASGNSIGPSVLSRRDLDSILIEFEEDWIGDVGYIQRFVENHKIRKHIEVIADLIRIDIELRYSSDREVDLVGYFRSFPLLLQDRDAVSGIAFEDFRSRAPHHLDQSPERWAGLPFVTELTWFTSLNTSNSLSFAGDNSAATGLISGIGENTLEPRSGTRFGDFDLLFLLGRGSFSEVYLARQESLASRYVAVKIVKRVLGEPAHLARMQHTGIVPIYSLHRLGEYSLLCMPYSGAATLSDWMRHEGEHRVARDGQSFVETVERTLQRLTFTEASHGRGSDADEQVVGFDHEFHDWNRECNQPLEQLGKMDVAAFILWFANRVASALAHAHDRGIVHGDIKPANILLRNDGEPALIDFNLSQSAAAPAAQIVGGTLPYMAPEQLRSLLSRQATLSTASDIFSFGVILYELVEGRNPFPIAVSTSETDLIAAISAQKSTRLTWNNPRISSGLRAIIFKTLSFSQADRYQDGGAMLQDLEREQANLPLLFASEPYKSRGWKLIRRYPKLFSAASIGVLATCAILVLGAFTFQYWKKSHLGSAETALANVRKISSKAVGVLIDARPGTVVDASKAIDSSLQDVLQISANDSLAELTHLAWLNEAKQAIAKNDLFDFYLSSAFLLHEQTQAKDGANLNRDAARREIERLLSKCEELPDLAEKNGIVAYLRGTIHQGVARTHSTTVLRARINGGDLFRSLDSILFARLSLANQDYSRVSDTLQALPNNSPFKSLWWLTLGESQLKLQHYEEARLSLSLALAETPNLVRALLLRADSHRGLGNIRLAIDDYSRAIEIEPDNPEFYADRARFYEQLGELLLAIKDVNRAIALGPHLNRSLLFRSRLLARNGQHDDAQKDLEKALELTPSSEVDWISRALAQLQNDINAALSDLDQAIRMNPRSTAALQNKAYIQAELLGETEDAVETLTLILEIDPEYEMARGGRCVLLSRLGQVDAALADIRYMLSSKKSLMPVTIFQIASAHSLLATKRKESLRQSLHFLALAIQRDYGHDLLETDPDLDNLRQETEFKELLSVSQLMTDQL